MSAAAVIEPPPVVPADADNESPTPDQTPTASDAAASAPAEPPPPAVPAHTLADAEADAMSEADGDAEPGTSDPTLAVGGTFVPQPAGDQSALNAVVQKRLLILMKLDLLAHERDDLAATPGLPADAKSEFERQNREMKRLPTTQVIREQLAKSDERIATQRKLAAEGGEGAPPPPSDAYLQAIALAKRQWHLLVDRDATGADVFAAGSALVESEPLFGILTDAGVDARPLFGWAVYATVVQTTRQRAIEQRDQLKQSMPAKNPPADLQTQLLRLERVVTATTRELTLAEPAMAAAFWSAYESAAAVLADTAKPLAADRVPHLRAFLRYGMIGGAPWFLPDDLAKHLLTDAGRFVDTLDGSLDATHVLYADEYLDLVARGVIAPSVDEDLELNQSGSPRWKQDRARRRLIASRIHTAALEQVKKQLEQSSTDLQAQNAKLDAEMSQLGTGPSGQAQRNKLRQGVQDNRVALARVTLALDRMNGKLLPDEQDRATEAEAKLCEAGGEPAAVELARGEASRLRHVSLLCNKLKVVFIPFVLRDEFRLDTGVVNDRATLQRELAEIERRDRLIFKEVAVPSKKPHLRTYVRYSPYVVIAPSRGIMGYSWNPRTSTEVGRWVVPGCSARLGGLTAMLYNLAADFRWDTSRETAGLDVLTSDTLVAAYCTIRWDFRKRSKELRERSGIHSEENDRKNFRRHYALYMNSAFEGAKQLFFKCHELYDAMVRHMVLPEGVQKLQK